MQTACITNKSQLPQMLVHHTLFGRYVQNITARNTVCINMHWMTACSHFSQCLCNVQLTATWYQYEYSRKSLKYTHEQRSQQIMNPSSCWKPQMHRVTLPSQLLSGPPTEVSTVVLHDTSLISNTSKGGGDDGYGSAYVWSCTTKTKLLSTVLQFTFILTRQCVSKKATFLFCEVLSEKPNDFYD